MNFVTVVKHVLSQIVPSFGKRQYRLHFECHLIRPSSTAVFTTLFRTVQISVVRVDGVSTFENVKYPRLWMSDIMAGTGGLSSPPFERV